MRPEEGALVSKERMASQIFFPVLFAFLFLVAHSPFAYLSPGQQLAALCPLGGFALYQAHSYGAVVGNDHGKPARLGHQQSNCHLTFQPDNFICFHGVPWAPEKQLCQGVQRTLPFNNGSEGLKS